jgi:hypothetical protein
MILYQYHILSEEIGSIHHPHRFKVEEVQLILPYKQIVDEWRVPVSAQLPDDPDPDEIMYGKNRDLMDMTCQKFSDLVRINQQLVVAKRYTLMLRDTISIPFGQRFKQNFELLQVLLGMLETQLQSTESTLEKKQELISRMNEQMGQIFAESHFVLNRSPYSFAAASKEAIISATKSINRGTLLSTGIHRWSVRCVNVVKSCELGVASPSVTPYKTGDLLSFVLDCTKRSLLTSINEREVATIPNIVLPVHIAFIGDTGAHARIL